MPRNAFDNEDVDRERQHALTAAVVAIAVCVAAMHAPARAQLTALRGRCRPPKKKPN